jgi:hypothetical protein
MQATRVRAHHPAEPMRCLPSDPRPSSGACRHASPRWVARSARYPQRQLSHPGARTSAPPPSVGTVGSGSATAWGGYASTPCAVIDSPVLARSTAPASVTDAPHQVRWSTTRWITRVTRSCSGIRRTIRPYALPATTRLNASCRRSTKANSFIESKRTARMHANRARGTLIGVAHTRGGDSPNFPESLQTARASHADLFFRRCEISAP